MGIARFQLVLGNYEEAVAAFQRAIDAYPKRIYVAENQLGMAVALERLGRTDDATAILRRAIAQQPDKPRLWALRQQLARIEGIPATAQ